MYAPCWVSEAHLHSIAPTGVERNLLMRPRVAGHRIVMQRISALPPKLETHRLHLESPKDVTSQMTRYVSSWWTMLFCHSAVTDRGLVLSPKPRGTRITSSGGADQPQSCQYASTLRVSDCLIMDHVCRRADAPEWSLKARTCGFSRVWACVSTARVEALVILCSGSTTAGLACKLRTLRVTLFLDRLGRQVTATGLTSHIQRSRWVLITASLEDIQPSCPTSTYRGHRLGTSEARFYPSRPV